MRAGKLEGLASRDHPCKEVTQTSQGNPPRQRADARGRAAEARSHSWGRSRSAAATVARAARMPASASTPVRLRPPSGRRDGSRSGRLRGSRQPSRPTRAAESAPVRHPSSRRLPCNREPAPARCPDPLRPSHSTRAKRQGRSKRQPKREGSWTPSERWLRWRLQTCASAAFCSALGAVTTQIPLRPHPANACWPTAVRDPDRCELLGPGRGPQCSRRRAAHHRLALAFVTDSLGGFRTQQIGKSFRRQRWALTRTASTCRGARDRTRALP
jgi:hypothetical protein